MIQIRQGIQQHAVPETDRRIQAAMQAVRSALGRPLVQRASQLNQTGTPSFQDQLCRELLSSRIFALMGPGRLTLAAHLALLVQEQSELPIWIRSPETQPHLPDLLWIGLDPKALPFVVVPDPNRALMVAERLVASQGFRLVILDLSKSPRRSATRLARLASETRATVLVLVSDQQPRPMGLIPIRISLTRPSPALYHVQIQIRNRSFVLPWAPVPEMRPRTPFSGAGKSLPRAQGVLP